MEYKEKPIRRHTYTVVKGLQERVLVVGLGQAGGNQAEIFGKNKVKSIAINASEEDFRNLNNVSKEKIGTYGGSGKDRGLAIEQLKPSFGDIYEIISKESEGKDYIILLSSLGGGTGSGCLPATAMNLRHLNKTIIVVATLPLEEEGIRLKNNFLSAMNELSKIEGINVMLVKNNFNYEKVNVGIYNKFNALFNREGKEIVSFDSMDLKNSLKGGYFDIFHKGNTEFEFISDTVDIQSARHINLVMHSRKRVDALGKLNSYKAIDKNYFEYRTSEKDSWVCILSDLKLKIDIESIKKEVKDTMEEIEDHNNDFEYTHIDLDRNKPVEAKQEEPKDNKPKFVFEF